MRFFGKLREFTTYFPKSLIKQDTEVYFHEDKICVVYLCDDLKMSFFKSNYFQTKQNKIKQNTLTNKDITKPSKN